MLPQYFSGTDRTRIWCGSVEVSEAGVTKQRDTLVPVSGSNVTRGAFDGQNQFSVPDYRKIVLQGGQSGNIFDRVLQATTDLFAMFFLPILSARRHYNRSDSYLGQRIDGAGPFLYLPVFALPPRSWIYM